MKLLEPIRQLSTEYIQTADHDGQIEDRIGVLIRSRQPLAEMGLNFVTMLPKPKPGAVMELATKTVLSFHQPERETGPFYRVPREGEPGVTHISAMPTTAQVT